MYRLNEKYWFFFRTKDVAKLKAVKLPLDYSSIQIFPENTLVVLLEQDGYYKKILTTDGFVGWIILRDKYIDCFKEVTS